MSRHPASLQELRVLIVEDESLIAEELRERLIRHGLSVVDVVDTGERAIQVATQHAPDLVLMDIRLKGRLDGVQAAEAIRRSVQAPVVFLTAHSDQDTLRRAQETEPFGYVLKPFDDRELVVAIEMSLHRHRLEQRLKESEQRYAATLSSIGDGVIATDPEGRVTFMNPIAEALTQWRLADARGLAIDHVFPVVVEATGAVYDNPSLEAMRLRRVVKLTEPVLMIARNREMIPIGDTAAPITDDTGKLLGAVMAFQDIRQRRLAEDALRQAEDQLRQMQKMEAVGQLADGMAHEFNNLLTVVLGYTNLLQKSLDRDDVRYSYAMQISDASRRAASLIQQLLTFTRQRVLKPQLLDCNHVVQETENLLRPVLGERIDLMPHLAPDLGLVEADPAQLQQLLVNLLVNARDAMPDGGELRLETANVALQAGQETRYLNAPPGAYVKLTVSDTGMGMGPEVMSRLFEPFFTTKEIGKGTGLGLAVVYGIVQQNRGDIEVQSAPAAGTTFTIYLPRVA
jgi:hypothetical protein